MIRGTVEALDLVQLLQLIYDCESSGELRIFDGERQHRLLFTRGQLLPEGADGAELPIPEFEAQLYGILFAERGSYIFAPRPGLEGSQVAAGLDTRGILVEATRRRDEWERINRVIPSRKAILIPTGRAAEAQITEKLLKLDLGARLRFGKNSVSEVLERVPEARRFDLLRELAILCAEGALRPVPRSELPRQIETRLTGKPRRSAFRLYEWLHEVDGLAEKAADFDHVLLRRSWLEVGGFSCRTPGPRALHVLSRLLRYKEDFEFTARGNDSAICVHVQSGLLEVYYRGEIIAPGLLQRVLERGLMTQAQVDEAARLADEYGCEPADLLVDRGFLHPVQWLGLRLDEMLDICFNIFTWRRPLLEVRPEAHETAGFKGDPFAASLILPLDDDVRHQLRLGLMKWKLFRQVIPSMDAIFVCARPTPAGQPRRAHDHLDGRRRVSDLLAMSRVTGQELLQFIYRAVKDGRARALRKHEHRRLMRKALERDRDADLLLAYRSGLSFGHDLVEGDEDLQAQIESAQTNEGKLTAAVAVLEGRFEAFNLAALVQLLLRSGTEGTLRVSEGAQERILHFVEGGLWVLLTSERRKDTLAPNEFLTESTEDLLESLRGAFEEEGEEQRSELQQRMVDDVLESLFWDSASFEFARNFVPSEFHSKSSKVTKIRLPEERFLFQAMQKIAEWEDLRHVLRSTRAIFEFTSAEAKIQAYQDFGEFVYFVDGQRPLRDLVKLAEGPRLELYRSLYQLIERGAIQLKGMLAARSLARSDTERMRWDLKV